MAIEVATLKLYNHIHDLVLVCWIVKKVSSLSCATQPGVAHCIEWVNQKCHPLLNF